MSRKTTDVPRNTTFDGTGSSISFTRHPEEALPPPMPIAEQIARQRARLKKGKNAQNTNLFSDDDKVREEAFAELQRVAEKALENAINPSVLMKRRLVQELWYTMLAEVEKDPPIPGEHYWRDTTVDKYWKRFPVFLVTVLNGKYDTRIKSRSLVSLCGTYLSLMQINMFSILPDGSHRKCGTWFATTYHVDYEIKAIVLNLTQEYKLSRHFERRLYYGRAEFALIVQAVMQRMEDQARDCFEESFLKVLLTFYTTARPSTLGPAYPDLVRQGHFFKLRHIVIHSYARGHWGVKVHYREFKAMLWTAQGTEQTFNIEEPKEPHNLLFDFPLWLILVFFKRGVFKKKFETIDDLINDTGAVLAIDPSKLDEPVFPRWKGAGRERMYPLQPQSAAAISASCRYLCVLAGLVPVGLSAFRRETGDVFGLLLGKDVAKDMMHHRTEGSFRDHYSRNTANYDVVGYRLGEASAIKIHGNESTTPTRPKNVARTGPAVFAVLQILSGDAPSTSAYFSKHRSTTTTTPASAIPASSAILSTAGPSAITADPSSSTSSTAKATSSAKRAPPFDSTEIQQLWDTLHACLVGPCKNARLNGQLNNVMKLPMKPGKEQTAILTEKALRAAYKQGAADRRNAFRKAKTEAGKVLRATLREETLPEFSRAQIDEAEDIVNAIHVPQNPAGVFEPMIPIVSQEDVNAVMEEIDLSKVDKITLSGDSFKFNKRTQEDKDKDKRTDKQIAELIDDYEENDKTQVSFKLRDSPGEVEEIHSVFQHSDLAEARIELLRYLVDSGKDSKRYRKDLNEQSIHDPSSGNLIGFKCKKCKLEIKGRTTVKLERHLALQHSFFVEHLEKIMVGEKDEDGHLTFDCPHGDYKGFYSRRFTIDHMMDNCIYRTGTQTLYALHKKAVNAFKEESAVANKSKSAQLVRVDRWTEKEEKRDIKGVRVPPSGVPTMQKINEVRKQMELFSVLNNEEVVGPTLQVMAADMDEAERLVLREERMRKQFQASRAE